VPASVTSGATERDCSRIDAPSTDAGDAGSSTPRPSTLAAVTARMASWCEPTTCEHMKSPEAASSWNSAQASSGIMLTSFVEMSDSASETWSDALSDWPISRRIWSSRLATAMSARAVAALSWDGVAAPLWDLAGAWCSCDSMAGRISMNFSTRSGSSVEPPFSRRVAIASA
jgi:hypothetical protein